MLEMGVMTEEEADALARREWRVCLALVSLSAALAGLLTLVLGVDLG